MNHRLTVTAAFAVILASVSVYPLIQGWGWFWGGVGAVIAVAVAGTLTRLPALGAAIAAGVLALVACCPLFTSPAWPLKALGVLIVAATAASLTRFRVLPALSCLITYVAALLLYLNAAYATSRSVAVIVPTRASIYHLWSLANSGLTERIYAPPVTGSHGMVLLAAAGIGLMAIATDLLAVRFRSPAIAGLPLLALYSVPITTNAKQGGIGATTVFCMGITGYLAMLAADGRDRLRIWGRLVTVWQNKDSDAALGPDTRTLAASGRRIGLAAVSLAILIPLLLPGVRVHGLLGGRPIPGGKGPVEVRLPDPLVLLQRQLQSTITQTVLTYHTNAFYPQGQYLQVYVLNNEDSNKWTLVAPGASVQAGSGRLLPAPGLATNLPPSISRTQIKMDPGVVGYGPPLSFLPLPYPPAALQVDGDWHEDKSTLMVYSTRTPLSGLAYTVTSNTAVPSKPQLEQAASAGSNITDDYLSYPSGTDGVLAKLASRITKDAKSEYDKALALQSYFTAGTFTYSVGVNLPNSPAGLVKFLTVTKRGYCQQFAFAMAALARLIGIPSRVAVGYTAGTKQSNGTWKVTTANAHAWPELFFSGAGWLRFEPTPGGTGGQATAVQPTYAFTSGGGGSPSTPVTQTGPSTRTQAGRSSRNGLQNKLGQISRAQGAATQASHRHGSTLPFWLLAVAVLMLALASPAAARVVIRRARWRRAADDAGLAHAAWRELRDDLADHGMACRASESPRAVAGRVATTLGLDASAREPLNRVASAEERARYATVPQPAGALREDVSAIRHAMSREAAGPARWRARLLPASTLAPVRSALLYAVDVFGWMDAASQRLRSGRGLSRQSLAERTG